MVELSWIERAYTNFVYRDLCHIFSGGLFICIFEYTLWDEIFLPEGFSLEVIGFLLVSYFLGIGIFSRINANMTYALRKIFKKSEIRKKYLNRLLLKQEIIDSFDKRIIDELERMNFFTLIGRTVGYSSFTSGIFMIAIGFIQFIFKMRSVTIEYSMISIFLLLFGSSMIYDYFNWDDFYVTYLNDFTEKIAEGKNKDLFEEEIIEQMPAEHPFNS